MSPKYRKMTIAEAIGERKLYSGVDLFVEIEGLISDRFFCFSTSYRLRDSTASILIYLQPENDILTLGRLAEENVKNVPVLVRGKITSSFVNLDVDGVTLLGTPGALSIYQSGLECALSLCNEPGDLSLAEEQS